MIRGSLWENERLLSGRSAPRAATKRYLPPNSSIRSPWAATKGMPTRAGASAGTVATRPTEVSTKSPTTVPDPAAVSPPENVSKEAEGVSIVTVRQGEGVTGFGLAESEHTGNEQRRAPDRRRTEAASANTDRLIPLPSTSSAQSATAYDATWQRSFSSSNNRLP